MSSFINFVEAFNNYNIHARLLSVYDADTITAVFPFPNTSNYYKYNVRLIGIDSPEMKSKDVKLRTKAEQARTLLLKYLNPNEAETSKYFSKKKKEHQQYLDENILNIRLECQSLDKYGRILAKVYNTHNNTITASEYLANQHVVYKYDGGTKLSNEQQNNIFTI